MLKVSGYNTQDMAKGRLSYNDKYNSYNSPLLTLGGITTIIETQGLNCHYCKVVCSIIPTRYKDPDQFTLDRVDNDKTHRADNCVVCCFKCNILRGRDYTSKEFKKIKGRC